MDSSSKASQDKKQSQDAFGSLSQFAPKPVVSINQLVKPTNAPLLGDRAQGKPQQQGLGNITSMQQTQYSIKPTGTESPGAPRKIDNDFSDLLGLTGLGSKPTFTASSPILSPRPGYSTLRQVMPNQPTNGLSIDSIASTSYGKSIASPVFGNSQFAGPGISSNNMTLPIYQNNIKPVSQIPSFNAFTPKTGASSQMPIVPAFNDKSTSAVSTSNIAPSFHGFDDKSKVINQIPSFSSPFPKPIPNATSTNSNDWGSFDTFDNPTTKKASGAAEDVFDLDFLTAKTNIIVPEDDPLGLLGKPVGEFKFIIELQKPKSPSVSRLNASQQIPELPVRKVSFEDLDKPKNYSNSKKDSNLFNLISMGFDESLAKYALDMNKGNFDVALDFLTNAPSVPENAEKGTKEDIQKSSVDTAAKPQGDEHATTALGTVFKMFEFGRKKIMEGKMMEGIVGGFVIAHGRRSSVEAMDDLEKDGFSEFRDDRDTNANSTGSNNENSEAPISPHPRPTKRRDSYIDQLRANVYGSETGLKHESSLKKQMAVKLPVDLLGLGSDSATVSIIPSRISVPTSDLLFGSEPVEIRQPIRSHQKHPYDSDYSGTLKTNTKQKSAIKPEAKSNEAYATPEQIEQSESIKAKGNDAFKRGQFQEAVEAYTNSMSVLPPDHKLRIILLNNRASALLKTGEYKQCILDCDNVLRIDNNNSKALLRRANAFEAIEDWSKALDDYRVLMGISSSPAVSLSLARCNQALEPKVKITKKANVMVVKMQSQVDEAVTQLRNQTLKDEQESNRKDALKDEIDAQIASWSKGKEENIRALISSLDSVLWPELGWKNVGLGQLITPQQVKIAYMKAVAKVHPDKHRMISASVFSIMNKAYESFKAV